MIIPPPRAATASPSGAARVSGRAVLLCVLAGLSACGPATGDFGRPKPSVVHDALMPAAGDALARQRGEPVSAYRLTDNEREMRDLAWAVVMPPLAEQRRDRVLVELRRTRILPADRARLDKASYVEALIATSYRSSAARYAKLIDDVVNDTSRVEPFFEQASLVYDDDRARERALGHALEVRPDERENALARIDENRLLIAWVRDSFEERLAAYRYALDRLVIETPDRASIEAARAIEAFAAVLRSLRPLGPIRGVFKG